jgi:exonuclease-1
MTRCLFIKTKQICLFQELCTELGIEHITAPYEADAQMAYMVKEGLADFAITEDSDLIAFGCTRTCLKINWNGFAEMFDIEKFKAEQKNEEKGWDDSLRLCQTLEHDQFVEVCIMAGCEYIPSIDRVGLKVVLKNMLKLKTCDAVIEEFRKNPKMKDRVPENYWEEIQKVKQIFKFQTVYDPRTKRFCPLFEPKEGETFDQHFVGDLIDPDDMEDYANGQINKKTLQPYEKYIG